MSEDSYQPNKNDNSFDQLYENPSDCESLTEYTTEGYYPIQLGETIQNYKIIQKLGWGHFSTVWMVLNKNDNQYYALKILKSKESYFQSAQDEIQLLTRIKQIQGHNYNIILKDHFVQYGVFGKHQCLVFELVGPNLLDLIQHYEFNNCKMPVWLAKLISKQVLMGLDQMHSYGIIHTDIKPENVMIQLDHDSLDLYIHQIKSVTKLPMSMKYLKLQQINSQKKSNKKKYQKKKAKKAKNKTQQSIQQSNNQQIHYHSNNQQIQDQQITHQIQNIKIDHQNKDCDDHQNKDCDDHQNKDCDDHQNKESHNDQNKECDDDQNKECDDDQNKECDDDQNKECDDDQNKECDDDFVSVDSEGNIFDSNILMWKKKVRIALNEKIKIKIVDFGNACWTDKHFTDQIQTREYRSLEGILVSNYNEKTDLWSTGCMIFEMITNNYLFNPRKDRHYSQDDDHLAQIQETLGRIPKKIALAGKDSRDYFNKDGKLISIKNLKPCSIKELLMQFKIKEEEAGYVESFLLPMLHYDIEKRIDAKQALQSAWLQ